MGWQAADIRRERIVSRTWVGVGLVHAALAGPEAVSRALHFSRGRGVGTRSGHNNHRLVEGGATSTSAQTCRVGTFEDGAIVRLVGAGTGDVAPFLLRIGSGLDADLGTLSNGRLGRVGARTWNGLAGGRAVGFCALLLANSTR